MFQGFNTCLDWIHGSIHSYL